MNYVYFLSFNCVLFSALLKLQLGLWIKDKIRKINRRNGEEKL